MASCSKIISLFNPCSKHHHALKDFALLKREDKNIVRAITSIVAILSFGLLAVVVFRGLIKKFSVKKLSQHQKIRAQKINHLSKKTIQRPQKSLIEDIDLLLNQTSKQKIEIPKQIHPEKPLAVEKQLNQEKELEIKNLHPDSSKDEENPFKDSLDKEAIPLLVEKNPPQPLNHEENKGEVKDLDPIKDQKSVENPTEVDKKEIPPLPNPEPQLEEQPVIKEQDLENKIIQDMLEKAGIQNINDFVNADNDTLLKQAVITNDIEKVKILLKHGADPNITKVEDLPLHYAAAFGNLEMVKILAPITRINTQGQLKKTALTHAIRNRKMDIELVKCLLEHGADPNIPDEQGVLPLHIAASFGDNGIVDILLLKTQNINAQDNQKRTFLYYAVRNNHLETAKIFLKKDADTNISDHANNLPIHLAAKNNNLDLVNLLLPHLKDVNAQDMDQRTILNLLASKTDAVEIIKTLLGNKADANIPDRYNNIPLHHAVYKNLEVVRLLALNTKNINAQDNDKWTSLYHAVVGGKEEIVEFLLNLKADAGIPNAKGNPPLYSAILDKNLNIVRLLIPKTKPLDSNFLHDGLASPEIVKELLAHGVDANVPDEYGDFPLHSVILNENFEELLQLLLPKTKNIDALNKANQSPLHLAILLQEVGVVKMLLDHGADIELPVLDGVVPLAFVAKQTENVEIIKLVFQRYLDKQDESKKTKLHHAVISEDPESVKALLEENANPNIQDSEGMIPLHYAVQLGNQEITQLLIPKSNINTPNNDGYTPLFLAVLLKREEIVKVLLESGADKKIILKDGMTIPKLAQIMKNQRIIELLMEY